MKVQSEVLGGEGRAGVSGTGVGLSGSGRRRRGSSFGILSLRFGMADAALRNGAGDDEGCGEGMAAAITGI